MVMNNTIAFREMQIEDIERIYEIEEKSFALPWSQEAFYNELTKNNFAVYTVVGGMIIIGTRVKTLAFIDEAHSTRW